MECTKCNGTLSKVGMVKRDGNDATKFKCSCGHGDSLTRVAEGGEN